MAKKLKPPIRKPKQENVVWEVTEFCPAVQESGIHDIFRKMDGTRNQCVNVGWSSLRQAGYSSHGQSLDFNYCIVYCMCVTVQVMKLERRLRGGRPVGGRARNRIPEM